MKNKIKIALVLTITFVTGLATIVNAQSVYKIVSSKSNDMKLSGTSTLHKWTMDAQTFIGEAEFEFKPGNSNELIALKSLTFSLLVENLKSGEKGLDKNAYKALKTDTYKLIHYKLLSATILSEKGDRYLLKARGNLTISGVTKEVVMDVHCIANKNESVTCNGSFNLKMTDYQVKPPSFMLGAMKTGDDLMLDFTVVYAK